MLNLRIIPRVDIHSKKNGIFDLTVPLIGLLFRYNYGIVVTSDVTDENKVVLFFYSK